MKFIAFAAAFTLAVQATPVAANQGDEKAWAFTHQIYRGGSTTLPALMTKDVCMRIAKDHVKNASIMLRNVMICTNIATGEVLRFEK